MLLLVITKPFGFCTQLYRCEDQEVSVELVGIDCSRGSSQMHCKEYEEVLHASILLPHFCTKVLKFII